MLKKFLIFSALFLFSFANYAYAHTHLESSSPQNGEVLIEQLKEITLTFEGKIEQSSTFTLQNENNEEMEVDSISVSENKLTGSLSDPLENGEYLIDWSIIGADGHVIEGEIPFTVDVPVTETNDDAKEDIVNIEVNTRDTKETESTVKQEQVDNELTENKSSYLTPTLIGVLVLIIVGSFLFIAKRKQ
ncbi:MAG TPA: copper resistance CopC family protein [Ureibacillus sp.]|nr:copper resistance CopC family protein [Ureibacillus sp.]